jgi:hypothetical protein
MKSRVQKLKVLRILTPMSKKFRATIRQIQDGSHETEITYLEAVQRFTPEQLSDHISELAALRAQLLPLVRMDPPKAEGMPNVANDPPWLAAYDEMNDRTALLVRHPGIGWIGYSLSMASSVRLSDRLKQVRLRRKKQRRMPT